jgi:predicted porin
MNSIPPHPYAASTLRVTIPAALSATLLALPLAASAQTDIRLYGILDVAIEHANSDADRAFGGGGSWRVQSSDDANSKGSRVGLRGSEDLGNGTKAIFALDHRLEVDTGNQTSGAFWAGEAWVGLQGRWGQLSAGRQYTPMQQSLRAIDASGDQWYGTLESGSRYSTRFDNSLRYESPKWSDLSLYAMYALGETQPDNTDRYGLGAVWASGSLVAMAGYQHIKVAPSGSTEQWTIGAAWKFGQSSQIGAGYIRNDPDGDANDISYPFVTTKFGLGPGAIYLSLIGSDFESGLKDSYRLALAYDYPLSKRTKLYLAAALDRDVRDPASTTAAPVYLDPQRVALGLRHDF